MITPLVLAACYGAPPCPDDSPDADNDGWRTCEGDRWNEADCDDSDPAVNPDATEVCDDGLDNDCDGSMRESTNAEVCSNGIDDDCDELADGEDPDCDTADPGGVGTLSLTYGWSSETITSCSAAGLSSLTVRVTPDGGTTTYAMVYPCNDAEIRVNNMAEGAYSAQIHGEATSGVLWTSEAVAFEVVADQSATLAVTLTCDPNGVEGGCP